MVSTNADGVAGKAFTTMALGTLGEDSTPLIISVTNKVLDAVKGVVKASPPERAA
ncbi:hypothetical protein MCEGE10_02910 [Flavobacteriaceae bacterium]